MDALTKEQLVVYVYVQVITVVKLFLVRWDQVWGTGGHCKGQALVSLQPVWHPTASRGRAEVVAFGSRKTRFIPGVK